MRYTLYILLLTMLLAFDGGDAVAQTAEDPTVELVRQIREAQARGDADGSFDLIDKVYEARCFANPFDAEAWAEVVTLKAKTYGMKYDWDKAIKIGMDAYIMLQSTPHGAQYAETLYELATFYAGRGGEGDFKKAILYALTAQDFFNKKSRSYFACGNDLAYYYMILGNPKEAQGMAKDAIKRGELVFGEDQKALAKELWSKAEDIAELEEYAMAETYAQSSIDVMLKSGDTLSIDYVRRQVKLAGYFFQQRDFSNEIVHLEAAAPAAKSVGGPESKEYVDVIRKLALAYNHKANEIRDQRKQKALFDASLKESEHYEDLARDILINTNRLDEIRVPQLPLISNAALKLDSVGETDKAIRYELVAAQLCEKYEETAYLANSYSHLSMFYKKNSDVEKSLEYGSKAVAIYDKMDSVDVFKQMTYNNYALCLHEADRDKEALMYGLKSSDCLEQMGDTLGKLYSTTLNNISVYYDALGMTKESVDYGTRASNVLRSSVQSANEAILASMQAKKKKKRKDAEPVKLHTIAVDRNMVVREWNNAVNADNNSDESTLHESYGNAVRMQRQLFIDKFSNAVEDATADGRRVEWKAQKVIFDFASNLAYSYRSSAPLVRDAWDAMLIADGMERYIETGDTAFISRTVKNMQDELPEGTACVRFFTTETNKGLGYSALVIRKDWEAPRAIVPLFSQRDIEAIDMDEETTVGDLLPTADGRKKVMAEWRVGDYILEPVLTALGDLSSVKEVRYHAEGMLLEIDPAELFYKEGELVRSLFRMVKE